MSAEEKRNLRNTSPGSFHETNDNWRLRLKNILK
jgi:hypothetical protein